MLKRVMLFIDSSNFYHSLKQSNLLDIFSYKSLYDGLSKEYAIVKVFFYDAIKNSKFEQEQYSKQQLFHERLMKEIPNIVIRSRKLKYILINDKIEYAKAKSGFCRVCINKVSSFLANAGLLKLSKEKGVDIMLVTDMIKFAYQDKYDVALLATGDADFVPAVELVQTLKKEVINLHFYAGSSTELRNICDSHKLIQIDANGACYVLKEM